MQAGAFLRPLRTHYRLGWSTIRSGSPVKVAAARLGEKATRRDDFDDNLLVIFAFGLAQVGSLAVADQRFEQRLLRAAADVELNIPAAGGASLVIRGAARRGRARIGVRGERKRAFRRGGWSEVQALESPALDDGEPVGAEAASSRGARSRADAAFEPVCRAPAHPTIVTGGEEAARDVDARVAPEFALALEDGAELDALGMSEEPGRIVILVGVDGRDANRDVERAAMPPETAAWWRRQ